MSSTLCCTLRRRCRPSNSCGKKFATLGIGPGGTFDSKTLTPEMRSAIEGGIGDAWAEFNAVKAEKFDTGQVGSADIFGTAEFLQGNYLYRMIAAALGIYGNTAAEAIYPYLSSDSAGAPLNWRPRLHRPLSARTVAAGQRVLVADNVRDAPKPVGVQPN